MSKTPSLKLELEDRDPNVLSQHLQVNWEDIIGEPDKIRSPECAWRVSNICFQTSKNICYIFLSILCAPLTAMLLGIMFACIAFEHIWCITPGIRLCKITCAATRTLMLAFAEGVIVPITKALSYVWSGFKIRTQTLPEGPDRKDDILLI